MNYTKYLAEAKTAESVRKELRTSIIKVTKLLTDIEGELDKIDDLGTSDVGKSFDIAIDDIMNQFYNWSDTARTRFNKLKKLL